MEWMSKKELQKLSKDPHITKYTKSVSDREKAQRRSKRREWWKDNWIAVSGMAISIVSVAISLIALLKQ